MTRLVPTWHRAGVLGLLLLAVGCGGAESPGPTPSAEESLSAVTDTTSLLTVLKTDDRFTTLVTALDSAGLTAELASAGPYTVLAPTNDAFATLPPGTMPDLLAPEGHDRLRVILTNHLLPRRLTSRDLVEVESIPTRAGDTLSVQAIDETIQIENARLLASDVYTANGIIHVLDAVLRPPE